MGFSITGDVVLTLLDVFRDLSLLLCGTESTLPLPKHDLLARYNIFSDKWPKVDGILLILLTSFELIESNKRPVLEREYLAQDLTHLILSLRLSGLLETRSL